MRGSLLAVAFAGIFLSPTLQAQEEPPVYSSHLRATVGFSTIGFFASLTQRVAGVASVDVTSNPALQLTYTYKFYDRVSLGVGLSRQVFSIRYRGYEYEGEDGTTLLDNFTTYIRRFNIAGLALVHYNRGSVVALYSGLRLGISRWTFDTNAKDINYTVGRFLSFALGTQVAPQLILVGGNTYFTPHFGANFEVGIGAPHLFSVGVGYRW